MRRRRKIMRYRIFLRNALYQQLSLDRVDACFALQVQLQDPAQ
jgi:hypothetical protein